MPSRPPDHRFRSSPFARRRKRSTALPHSSRFRKSPATFSYLMVFLNNGRYLMLAAQSLWLTYASVCSCFPRLPSSAFQASVVLTINGRAQSYVAQYLSFDDWHLSLSQIVQDCSRLILAIAARLSIHYERLCSLASGGDLHKFVRSTRTSNSNVFRAYASPESKECSRHAPK